MVYIMDFLITDLQYRVLFFLDWKEYSKYCAGFGLEHKFDLYFKETNINITPEDVSNEPEEYLDIFKYLCRGVDIDYCNDNVINEQQVDVNNNSAINEQIVDVNNSNSATNEQIVDTNNDAINEQRVDINNSDNSDSSDSSDDSNTNNTNNGNKREYIDLYDAAKNACTNRHMNILDYIWSKTEESSAFIFDLIVATGDLNMVKYYHSHISQFDENELEEACYTGNLEIIKYIHETGVKFVGFIADNICHSGNLDALKYALANGGNISYKGEQRALEGNHTEIIKYLGLHHYDSEPDNYDTDEADTGDDEYIIDEGNVVDEGDEGDVDEDGKGAVISNENKKEQEVQEDERAYAYSDASDSLSTSDTDNDANYKQN